jgi:acetyl esterase/lipase
MALLADRARRPVAGVLLSPWMDLALTALRVGRVGARVYQREDL